MMPQFAVVIISLLLFVSSIDGLSMPVPTAVTSNVSTRSNIGGAPVNTITSPAPTSPVAVSYNREALEAFKFPRTYVPLASIMELDPDRPTPLEFLGQRYVAYRQTGDDRHDETQNWIVLDDACPHRLAPLSEGRINRHENDDDGTTVTSTTTLQCSYHGWEFDARGQCTSIPQASANVERAAIKSPRSCVAAYPSTVERGVLWIWPWKQDVIEATLAASSAGEGRDISPAGLLKGTPQNPSSTYTRDLPYSYDILVENLLDPSHVPFAHHGLQGRRSDALPINMTNPIGGIIDDSGFAFEWSDRTMGMMRKGMGRFRAPFTVAYDAKFYEADPPREFNLAVLCLPIRAGWSRAIILGPGRDTETKTVNEDESDTTQPAADSKKAPSFKSKLLKVVFSSIPVWVVHQLNNRFLDSDMAFLHFQGRERARRNSSSSSSEMSAHSDYYMPAQSDRCISALRSWFTKYMDLSPMGSTPPALSRSEMFNRWSQHTSHCKHCQQGLKTLQKARRAAFGVLALSVFGFKYTMGKVVFLFCVGGLTMITHIEKSFTEGEFKHYQNH